jgi:hypothetical protein
MYSNIRTRSFRVGSLLEDSEIPSYDIVLHLRYEDFIEINEAICPSATLRMLDKHFVGIKGIVDNSSKIKVAIVLNKPTSFMEKMYVDIIEKWFSERNIDYTVESNDIATDFKIMRKARVLIASNSTISWCAAFLADKSMLVCLMPDYPIKKNRIFQTFKRPHPNTILYSISN